MINFTTCSKIFYGCYEILDFNGGPKYETYIYRRITYYPLEDRVA